MRDPVAATAGAGSLLLAVVVLVLEIGPPWQWPGPSDLLLPAVGCVLGVGATLMVLAGRGARRRLLLPLGATLLAAPILAGLVLLGTAEREPLVRDSPAMTSEEKRRLYDLLRDQNPKTLEAGDTRSLSLDSRDIDLLLAWGLPVVLGEGRGTARVDLMASRQARMSLTLRFATPTGRARYLNIVAGARVQIDRGRVSVADPTLRLGRLASYAAPRPAETPKTVIAALGPGMLALAGSHTDGAHPYLVTPAHTREARRILGSDKLLCPEQTVLAETDPARARRIGRARLGRYLEMTNYRRLCMLPRC
jgi:hypothetical protein